MGKTRIFIVEDERRIARFLQIELEHEGFETETEENGTRAYERIMQGNFDLVLLDVVLPDIDGYAVAPFTTSQAHSLRSGVRAIGAKSGR